MTYVQLSPPAVRPLWSARRTAVAVVAAVAIASVSAVAVSYADTGSSNTPGRGGQFGGPGQHRNGGFGGAPNLGGGQFGGPPGMQNGGPGQQPDPTHT